MKRILCLVSIILLAAVFMQIPVYPGENACDAIEWISEMKGIKLSSTEQKADKCERIYLIEDNIDDVFRSVKKGFISRGWEIIEDADVDVPGIQSSMFKAVYEGMEVEAATQQSGKDTKLAVELKGSMTQSKGSKEEGDAGFSSVTEELPVPKGASLISSTEDDEDYVLTYSYAGDMSKAISWISSELKKQGWEVDDDSIGDTIYALGATIEAKKGRYELDISFSQTASSGTIVYTLSE